MKIDEAMKKMQLQLKGMADKMGFEQDEHSQELRQDEESHDQEMRQNEETHEQAVRHAAELANTERKNVEGQSKSVN